MRRPASNGLLDWIGAATEDMADSVARLNHDLDRRETDPQWGRRAWRDSWDIVSLRRWAFLLPGGGALRGGRKPGVIQPATRPTRVAVETPVVATPVVVPSVK